MKGFTLMDLENEGLTIANDNGAGFKMKLGLFAKPRNESAYETEKELDKACVKLFRDRKLRDRTDFDITRDGECRGWYVHIRQSKGNPYTLDYLILWHKIGRYCEIELKSRTGAIRPIQQQILEHGGAVYMCRTIEEVKRALDEAERQPELIMET